MKESPILHPWRDDPAHTNSFRDIGGTGGLWRYGPNFPADFAILTKDLGCIALITRRDNGLLALPGGFVDKGELAIDTAIREANEETGITLTKEAAEELYSGPVADYRATLRAWPHTTLFRFLTAHTLQLNPNDDAIYADWYEVETLTPDKLHGSHFTLIQKAILPLR